MGSAGGIVEIIWAKRAPTKPGINEKRSRKIPAWACLRSRLQGDLLLFAMSAQERTLFLIHSRFENDICIYLGLGFGLLVPKDPLALFRLDSAQDQD